MTAARILIVDEEVANRRELHGRLYTDGFDVMDVERPDEAIAIIRIRQFDVVVLRADTRQRQESRTCRLLRSEIPHVGIVVLSESDDCSRKVERLEAGADDYLIRPFRHEELVARIRAILRRSHPAERVPNEVIEIGDIRLDAGRRVVFKSGEPVHLTPKEYCMLHYLMLRAGLPVTHSALLNAVWGPDQIEEVAYLRTFMRQLRKKLDNEGYPRYLFTDCYIGYHFVEPESAPRVRND